MIGVTIAIFIFSDVENEVTSKSIIPTIGIYAASAFRILPALNRIITGISRIRFVSPAIKSVYEDLNKQIKKNETPKSIKIDKIHIKNLSFSYKKPKTEIFNRLNFQINKGDKILVYGDSGEGKSTFLDLLAGLQEADDGEIIVNDEFKIKKNFNLTKSLGYVSQKVFLFNKSLKYNISLSEGKVDEKKLRDAIKISNLDTLVNTYKDNFEIILGDNGAILSGGQKQRVMLARAIYNSGNFLLMDEPTSSLDDKTAKIILTNLISKKDLTIIMVSHNVEYKKFFSKTIEIKKKDIVENKTN